ncbi:MAG: hypothetical protein PHH28_01445 [Desulfuromonadaceae bacterium]|nr:hypothetical protein [Desulfuromonadaceae bacterium]
MCYPDSIIMIPDPHRIAIHQAGHAVVQTLVGRERFVVSSVSINADQCDAWEGLPALGKVLLDRKVFLRLYEFGLVTLAGIAAEDSFLLQEEPEENPVVALSDLAAWQEQAWVILQDAAKVQLVSLNVMRKLHEWMADDFIWRVVEQLADALLVHGMLEGDSLQHILAPIADFRGQRADFAAG